MRRNRNDEATDVILGSGLDRELEDVLDRAFESDQGGEVEIVPPDTRTRVTPTVASPFRYICNLEFDFPAIGRRAMCSGTLIGPSTVLTAGHCLLNDPDAVDVTRGLRTPGRLRVVPGRDGASEPFPSSQAVEVQVAFCYAPATPTDYGVIQLRDPIGNQVGYWTINHTRSRIDPVGTSISAQPQPTQAGHLSVNLSGYPADKPSVPPSGCEDLRRDPRFCRNSSLGDPRRQRICGTQQFQARDMLVTTQQGMLIYRNDTCQGHSGSPVWVARPPNRGGNTMIGVHVAFQRRGITNQAVRISPSILEQIQCWLVNSPVPPPIGTRGYVCTRPYVILERFRFDQSVVLPHHRQLIEFVANRIVARARTPQPVRVVRLVGHTDNRGPDAHNQGLGQRRAQAALQALQQALRSRQPALLRHVRLVPDSRGETRPAADNNTDAGRACNRRVEIFLDN